MKHLILALTLTVGFAPPHLRAQLELPDYYGEACKKTIGFWENDGQIKDPSGLPVDHVLYYSQGAMPRAYFRKNSTMSIVLHQPTSLAPMAPIMAHRLDVRPYLAANVNPEGNVLKDHYQKFYLPWCGPNGAHSFGYDWLKYPAVFDGIDMVFYSGSAGQKMAFYCWPGSDPTKLALQFNGQDSLRVDVSGFLKVWKNGTWVKLEEAVAYQVGAGNQVIPLAWNATYTNINGNNVVELGFSTYDPTLPLVLQIGPTPAQAANEAIGFCWNTYYGGNEREEVFGTTTDEDGNFYATGYTYSSHVTFPDVTGTSLISSTNTVVLAKFDEQHDEQWTLFYGGSDQQNGEAVVVKGTDVYVCGWTVATDLVTEFQSGAYFDDTDNQFTAKGFVAKFNSIGEILWGTYFGDGNEWLRGMALDSQGRLMVVGTCTGTYPAQTASGASSWAHAGGKDMMLARFGPNDELQWCTSYGGSGDDEAHDIVFLGDRATVLGETSSTNIPVVNGGAGSFNQTSNGGQRDLALLSFNSSGTCNWATYLGGSDMEYAGMNGLCIDEEGSIVVGGSSHSTNLATQNGGGYMQSIGSAIGAGYLARFDGTTRARTWATFIGGPALTRLHGVDVAGNKLFAYGFSNQGGLPVVQANNLYSQGLVTNGAGAASDGHDGILWAFDNATNLSYSTYIGGTEGGRGEGVRSLAYYAGTTYLAGVTSPSFPVVDDFPLFNPGPPAYFKGSYLAGDFWSDWFLGALCTGEFTGAVGIEENATTNGMTVLPLGNGLFRMQLTEPAQIRYQVVDAAGRVVHPWRSATVGQEGVVLDLHSCANGIYVVHALVNARPVALKLTLNR